MERQWAHHLNQDDVDALVAAERLLDFTHTWSRGMGWLKIEPPVTPTAEQVNEWSLRGLGHDAINADVVIAARCERAGFAVVCPRCEGHSPIEAYPGQRTEAEAWQQTDPPTGEGWQLWETVSEGSPITLVFATAEVLIKHLVAAEGFRRVAAEQLVADGSTIGSFAVTGDGLVLDSARDAAVIAS